jgi:Sec-independent protein translocase protein TatA
MPDFSTIKDLGSFGIILLAFVLLVWKGAPFLTRWLADLLATFRAEIRSEREFGAQQLDLERQSRAKSEERMTAAIERNTQAIERNTAATQALQKAVEDIPKQ